MTSLLEVFWDVDDFWQSFDPLWQSQQKTKEVCGVTERVCYPPVGC